MSLPLTAQGNGLQLRGLGRIAPQQTQITGTLPRQFDLTLIDTLIGEAQTRHLPVSPTTPVLQIVTGLDAETLKSFLCPAPVQIQTHQRRIDGAGIEQPAAQLLLAFGRCIAAQFDQRARGAALDAQRGYFLSIGAASQRKPAYAMLLFLLHGLAAPRNQRIGLHLAVAVEYAQIAQIAMPGGKVGGEGQLQAIPGALAAELQGRTVPIVLQRLASLNLRRQRQAQEQAAMDELHTVDSCSSAADASALRGGNGAK